MRRNRLRELLNAGQPTLGTHIHSSWASIHELVGHSRMFDYIEFVAEYAPYDLYALENIGRAIDLFPHMSSMMKIEQEPRTYLTIRAIGSGIQNVLFADPRSVADVEECVRAVRSESPHCKGRHGVGMRRDVGFVLEAGTPAFVQSLDDAVIALMIEKASAVENLEAILSVKGVDMVQFGPADYSMSIGIPGQFRHPKVKEAEKFVIETCHKMGVHPRAEINHPSQAKEYLDMGVKHFCMGNDTTVLFDWFKEQGKALGQLVGRSPSDELGEDDRRGYRG
jgi:4-hydroxy-2-oxoheptanedioate aldolase